MRDRKPFIAVLFMLQALLSPHVAAADFAADLKHLQDRWAEINYELEGKAKVTAFGSLVTEADTLVAAAPDSAEPLIWRGIIKSTYAGAKGGLGALGLAKEAKADLEKALSMDPEALKGSAFTTLGTLYSRVPGWPVGFGDDEKAEALLKEALARNPDGIDPNYFMGSFLIEQDRYAEARSFLSKAQNAPARPGRELADSGRQREISDALASIANK